MGKYFFAWLLGVPGIVLVIIYLLYNQRQFRIGPSEVHAAKCDGVTNSTGCVFVKLMIDN